MTSKDVLNFLFARSFSFIDLVACTLLIALLANGFILAYIFGTIIYVELMIPYSNGNKK